MTRDAVEIDGSEGGGQMVRSALALSALTGTPVTFENVRGIRPTPGLKPQHLAAIRAIEDICDADVEGAEEGAESFTVEPDSPKGGAYHVDVGTAGSVTLVFDTVLPLAVALPEPLSLTVTGGTAVTWAPPVPTYDRAKLPLLRRFGWHAYLGRRRHGFYPAGGGRATLGLAPSTPRRMDLTDTREDWEAAVEAIASDDLADAEVAARMLETAVDGLDAVDVVQRTTTHASTDSPGAVVTIGLDNGTAMAGFDALGERGTPAETVAERAVDATNDFLAGSASVDRHLGDQLVLVLGLVGGRVAVPEITEHVSTSLDVLAAFDVEADVDESGTVPVLDAPGHPDHRPD